MPSAAEKRASELFANIARWREDFPAYAAEQLKIIDKDGNLIPLRLNRPQLAVWRRIKKALDSQRPVRIYVLKARQMGFSTLFESIGYWIAALHKYKNGLVVAHEKEAAAKLFSKMQLMYRASSFRPRQKYSNKYELYFANPDPQGDGIGNESRVRVATAENPNVGVGDTLHFVHLSELAKYEHVNQSVAAMMTKLKQAIPHRAGTMVFIETTAEGFGYAKDLWEDPHSGYERIFVSWLAEEEYRYSDEIAAVDPNPDAHRVEHLTDLGDSPDDRYGNEGEYLDTFRRELKVWWPELKGAALEAEILSRFSWRRFKIDTGIEGSRDEKLRLFRQEYPSYPEEAFLMAGHNVFDGKKLADILYSLDERDSNGRVLGPRHPASRFRWDREAHVFIPAGNGELTIYEQPEEGRSYVIGVDSSHGLPESDPAAAQVLRAPDMRQDAVLVGRIEPHVLARQVEWLARHYNRAWINPEVKEASGGVVAHLLSRELHYPLLYRREMFDSEKKQYVKKVGFNTNRATKPKLIQDLREALTEDWIIFRDRETLEEMMAYAENDGEFGAPQGKHDDLVMALGLALQMALQAHLAFEPEPFSTATPPPPGSFEWYARLAERTAAGRGVHA